MARINQTLLYKTMRQLALCLVAIMLLCAPVFYYLNTRFYAEDLTEIIEQYRATGKIDTDTDLMEDVAVGITIQYVVIALVIGVAVMITMRRSTKRIWEPFDDTLKKIENFRLGKDDAPEFPNTDISEFQRLNTALTNLIKRDISSYKVQKEFTENASHELQTPIAIIRSDLDMLLQENLTQKESELVGNMYDVTQRLEHLNRSLLLLAKIENNQYEEKEEINLGEFVQSLLPDYERLFSVNVILVLQSPPVLSANRTLLQVLVNNLVVNALRNSDDNAAVNICITSDSMKTTNRSAHAKLNETTLFSRFNNPTRQNKGNGLGLAIVKQICDHYKWDINYSYADGKHTFTVDFS